MNDKRKNKTKKQKTNKQTKRIMSMQLAKPFCLPYYACVFSSTKLVIRAEQDLPGTEGGRGGENGGGGQGRVMTQCVHM
jgi:hypothetical protein